MIENLPASISLAFGATAAATLLLFALAVKKSISVATRQKAVPVVGGLAVWLALQAVLALNDVYSSDLAALPPRIFLFGILPMLAGLAVLFTTSAGRRFMDSLPLKGLTYLHVVRIPVEIGLYWLLLHKAVPQLMTFDGRNFDILAGLTAPLVAYFGFRRGRMNRPVLLVWNLACLGLLLNIVALAFLSAPSPLQRLAFEQPNVAILYFPVSWLPTFIVPVVLFCHLASIRQLLKRT